MPFAFEILNYGFLIFFFFFYSFREMKEIRKREIYNSKGRRRDEKEWNLIPFLHPNPSAREVLLGLISAVPVASRWRLAHTNTLFSILACLKLYRIGLDTNMYFTNKT